MTDYLKKAEKALDYLAETEAEYARLKALVKYAPDRLKMYLAALMLESEEKSATAKKTTAEAHPEYEQTVDSFETISKEFFEIDEKRKRANMTIEMFRSVNSSLKKGNI